MRSALLCVIFAILAQRKGSHADRYDDEFNPIPIPLKEWNHKTKTAAGTLQEAVKTEAPIAAAALPAHYWEDALRHSVYLTLVRDKIDQMITKFIIVSPDNKPTSTLPKEVDDHDLWEKIKSAPFDRLQEDTIPPGDVAIIAKGRLVEENGGFRFAEDKTSQQKCSEQDCTKGVKAFWSVKRERQRDVEPSTGKYHYELTFSVTSDTPMKSKKPLDQPVRMFTVRENGPTDPPQFRRSYDPYRKAPRSQPSVWVHKNIGPTYEHRRKPNLGNLDRLFSSFFSDEDISENTQRYNPGIQHQVHQQFSKVGHSGEREFKEPFHHKKISPFPHPPQTFKFSRPQLPSPPLSYMQHAFVDMDHFAKSPYLPMGTDIKLIPNTIKTTRPAVLPTPVAPITFAKESTVEAPVKTAYNTTETTTKLPGVVTAQNSFKPHTHGKPTSAKPNYSPEHVRPPIYNAPPGVFVTMDKKPFKPMPPLKVIHSSLNLKGSSDFRPSPQVLDDVHLSEPDANMAFRPIAVGFPEGSKKNEDSIKNNQKHLRKTIKKPTKQSSIKTHRTTTTTPDIITAKDDSDEFDLEWANILGVMSKTTPMASYKDKVNDTDTMDIITTTASPISTTQIESEIVDTTTTSTTTTSTTTTTTTPKPTKRTRPPPKYKQDKYKKHKRITTTTTSSTTTAMPPRSTTEKRTTEDLTPQASSAATGGGSLVLENGNNTTTVKPITSPKPISTTTRTTTTRKITTTPPTQTSSAAVKTEKPIILTIQEKNKNRFRQSTLMYKGTSVKHDKWSAQPLEKNRISPVFPSKPPVRRLASKFQGYLSSPAPTTENIITKETTTTTPETSSITETNKESSTHSTVTSESNQNEEQDSDEELNSSPVEDMSNDAGIKDTEEYIFSTTAGQDTTKYNYTEKQTVEVTTSSYDTAKNKTKCKKKKHNNLTTTVESSSETPTSTEKISNDIFDELIGGFTMDDEFQDDVKPSSSTPIPDIEESESKKHEHYVIDDDLESFLDSLEGKGNHGASNSEENEESDESDENDDDEEEEYQLSSEEEESASKKSHYDDDVYYEDEEKKEDRPYSLLELMSM